MDIDHLASCRIDGTGHLRPAFGNIGRGVGAGRRANLKHVARAHGVAQTNGNLFVASFDQLSHAQALIACALETHELRTRGSPQVRVGKTAIKRHAQPTLAYIGSLAAP